MRCGEDERDGVVDDKAREQLQGVHIHGQTSGMVNRTIRVG